MLDLNKLDKELTIYKDTNTIFTGDALDYIYKKMQSKINKLKAKVTANKITPNEVHSFFYRHPEYSEVFPETFELLYRTRPYDTWEEHFKNVNVEGIKERGKERRAKGEQL